MNNSLFISFSTLVALLIFGLVWWLGKGRKQSEAEVPEKATETSEEVVSAPEKVAEAPEVLKEPIKLGQKGIIKNLRSAYTMIDSELTVFEIKIINTTLHAGVNIIYAGVYGQEIDPDIENGALIEFWLSPETIMNNTYQVIVINNDGTKTIQQKKDQYYALEKYRILKPEVENAQMKLELEKVELEKE